MNGLFAGSITTSNSPFTVTFTTIRPLNNSLPELRNVRSIIRIGSNQVAIARTASSGSVRQITFTASITTSNFSLSPLGGPTFTNALALLLLDGNLYMGKDD